MAAESDALVTIEVALTENFNLQFLSREEFSQCEPRTFQPTSDTRAGTDTRLKETGPIGTCLGSKSLDRLGIETIHIHRHLVQFNKGLLYTWQELCPTLAGAARQAFQGKKVVFKPYSPSPTGAETAIVKACNPPRLREPEEPAPPEPRERSLEELSFATDWESRIGTMHLDPITARPILEASETL